MVTSMRLHFCVPTPTLRYQISLAPVEHLLLLSQSADHWGIIAVGMIVTQSLQVKTNTGTRKTQHIWVLAVFFTLASPVCFAHIFKLT